MIFIIKVTTNKEDRALELISAKIHKKNLLVYSLARPHGLRGYIFLEAEDRDSAEEAAYNLPYVKGIIGKTLDYSEIKNMLEPTMEEINIEKGDIVEIIAGIIAGYFQATAGPESLSRVACRESCRMLGYSTSAPDIGIRDLTIPTSHLGVIPKDKGILEKPMIGSFTYI